MHTCISSHGLKRSWRSCPRWLNAGNKYTPSMHHPRRRNVTTWMVGLKKNGHIRKNLTQKMVNPRDIAGERRKKRKEVKDRHGSPCFAWTQTFAIFCSVLSGMGLELRMFTTDTRMLRAMDWLMTASRGQQTELDGDLLPLRLTADGEGGVCVCMCVCVCCVCCGADSDN